RVSDAGAELTRAASASADTAGIGLALTTLLAGLATWGSLVVGVPAVHSGRLDGTLLAVIVLVPLAAFELVVGLPVATQTLQRTRQSAGRVFAVMDTPPPVSEPTAPATVPALPLELRGQSVSTRYPGQPTRAVDMVDVTVSPGRRVAVIGPSGAGKSALAQMLLRFLPYEDGSVVLDGGAPAGRPPAPTELAARAVLAEFPVLVLDEPAEHLDQAAADAMTADLLSLTSGRSTVLITHRLAGLEAVDEVLVLDGGRVVERGTHDELMAAGGRYADLWWREMRTTRTMSLDERSFRP